MTLTRAADRSSAALQRAGYRIKVPGTATAPVADVEISGFVVDGFETGLLLQSVVRSRIRSNEFGHNTSRPGSTTPYSQNGILLYGSSFNQISGNFAHDNGHMGIGLRSASHGNIVRGNRLLNNQTQYAPGGVCSLMVFAGSIGNQIVDNEVIDALGAGIMLGPAGVQSQNLVAGNRIHGHPGAGIVVEPGSQANVILQNDAIGNGLGGIESDLVDYNGSGTNLWIRNTGTCTPGNAGC